MTSATYTGEFDPFSPEAMDDPYPAYAELLRHEEPLYLEQRDMWLVIRYDHVRAAAKDHPGLSSAEGIAYHRSALPVLFGIDQPDHTRLRGLIRHAFSPRGVQVWRTFIERACAELLDEALAMGDVDIVQQAMIPLPVRVITTIVGVPGDDLTTLKLTAGVLESFIPNARVGPPAELEPDDPAESALRLKAAKQTLSAVAGLTGFLRGVLEQRRAQAPRGDLVSKLFAVEQDRVSEDEILWLCLTLLVGGQETMTHFLGSMVDALLHHPDQFRMVRERPELIPATIEETARFYPAVQNVFRTATTDVVVGNTRIPKDARVELSFAAANRDPRRFPDPNRYRIDRVTDGHLGFGAGIHTCVGAHLARLQAATFLRLLIERTDDIELIGELVKVQSPAFRGLDHLPLRLTPKSGTGAPAGADSRAGTSRAGESE
ncbi:cytochrome P450 [Plantactinospora sp. KLBMP9567]|uniref:cytochrome P450 n=1 Tax=Plantactinospora sp. KLBMP9567 TaxID=3085900 RepID=UPI002980AA9E|nr:cytochrome P450 [Plantactinospora sp. KLBMP9567]MDW5325684.1 cytochrome P450 [Plantactinospora sp. KLBMP9567]